VFRLRFQEVIAITLQGDFKALSTCILPLFTSLLFLGFLGFHFIYKGIISQKLILIVAFINVLL
jgi:hypothetical protein